MHFHYLVLFAYTNCSDFCNFSSRQNIIGGGGRPHIQCGTLADVSPVIIEPIIARPFRLRWVPLDCDYLELDHHSRAGVYRLRIASSYLGFPQSLPSHKRVSLLHGRSVTSPIWMLPGKFSLSTRQFQTAPSRRRSFHLWPIRLIPWLGWRKCKAGAPSCLIAGLPLRMVIGYVV